MSEKSSETFLDKHYCKQDYPVMISHRLRGYDIHDATKDGLIKALKQNVKFIEVDTRITKDDNIVINHDPHLREHFNSTELISQLTFAQIKKVEYKLKNGSILSLAELLDIFCKYRNKKTILCIDVKEYGQEDYLIQEIKNRSLEKNIVIFSWLPQVLFKINELNNELKLCFSHVAVSNKVKYFIMKLLYKRKKFLSLIEKAFSFLGVKIFLSYLHTIKIFNNEINKNISEQPLTMCSDTEYYVKGVISGELLSLLKRNNGWICIPYTSLTTNISTYYKNSGLKLAVYSINNLKLLKRIYLKFKPDFIFTDNAELLNYINNLELSENHF
jgi:glycerophosphoryl diester phosphodiesterase